MSRTILVLKIRLLASTPVFQNCSAWLRTQPGERHRGVLRGGVQRIRQARLARRPGSAGCALRARAVRRLPGAKPHLRSSPPGQREGPGEDFNLLSTSARHSECTAGAAGRRRDYQTKHAWCNTGKSKPAQRTLLSMLRSYSRPIASQLLFTSSTLTSGDINHALCASSPPATPCPSHWSLPDSQIFVTCWLSKTWNLIDSREKVTKPAYNSSAAI